MATKAQRQAVKRMRMRTELEIAIMKTIRSFNSKEHPKAAPLSDKEINRVLAEILAHRIDM